LFDRVVVVDWSAAARPTGTRPRADAIWLGVAGSGGAATHYLPTRAAAEAAIAGLSATGRVLIGFDFPMGYPTGFAARLTGRAHTPDVWRWLAGAITDGPANANNRFAVAAAINRQFGGAGPFWGCPAGVTLPGLGPRKAVDYPALDLSERRAVERAVPRAQPVWKLWTTGSVGSQSLMGLPLIHRLHKAGAAVWPFDPPGARVVVAEVYPSLLAAAVARDGGAIKDEVQVRLLARALWRLAQTGGLADLLAAGGDATGREEGWILGAGAARLLEAAL